MVSILVRYKAFILCIYNLENVHGQLISLQVSCLSFSLQIAALFLAGDADKNYVRQLEFYRINSQVVFLTWWIVIIKVLFPYSWCNLNFLEK